MTAALHALILFVFHFLISGLGYPELVVFQQQNIFIITLKGPLVRHFPRILHKKRWADIVFEQEQMAKQTQAITFDSLPTCDFVPLSSPTGQPPGIQMLTYTSDLAQQLFEFKFSVRKHQIVL